jgi:hypothetical protein
MIFLRDEGTISVEAVVLRLESSLVLPGSV